MPPEKPRDIAFIPSVLKCVPPSPDTVRLISAKVVFPTSLLSEHLGHSTIFGLAFDSVKSGIADCNDLSCQILFTLDEDSYNRT